MWPLSLGRGRREEKKTRTSSEWRGTIKWAVENGKMAAWRAMPDGGKGGSYKLQLYHEKHPHRGTKQEKEETEKNINENIRCRDLLHMKK